MYLPIAMLVVKYKSPIGRTQEENNPMKIQKCGTGAKETALQIRESFDSSEGFSSTE